MYKRIILKLSGETLADPGNSRCYDAKRVALAAKAIAEIQKLGVECGIVIGGGNIWRGRFTDDMNPVNADNMGMLATVMNAICLMDALRTEGVKSEVFSAVQMLKFAKFYTAGEVDEYLRSGGVALLSAGTGNPFFTTDTAAALRAAELSADAVFKGTNVKGLYDKDPNKYPDAKFIAEATYEDCIKNGYKVMDSTAFDICKNRNVAAIRVFKMDELDNIIKVLKGEAIGTTIHA
ncbi:MAG: UMP kinase [Clostridia bacterium]|nr:UMP kinase [Clostridia bacterium]